MTKAITYLITDGEYLKIGLSTTANMEKRLASLQTGNARELKLLGRKEGNWEQLIHQRFRCFRVRGEWFRRDPKILAYFEDSAQTPQVTIRRSVRHG
ncbi:GIY-YIG nuclease family protein [Moorena sp. SIO3A2]|uniref:GIY-YIG nuclease family protein n=1 Tax=Moorena sp. SIO3A2 TaxID=2607841 RepID=UPI0013BCB8E4|nr:GIY-YIG nuclease family protein [Moorena sp. SIO3A2]